MAAEAVGELSLHSIEGAICDLCGHACDTATQELNNLDCTYKPCSDLGAKFCLYHQDCLERYLKGLRLEKCAPAWQCLMYSLPVPQGSILRPVPISRAQESEDRF